MINPILALRVTQGLLALIVLGTAAYAVNSFDPTSDEANFMVFNVCIIPFSRILHAPHLN
jgi:hypothetical protein